MEKENNPVDNFSKMLPFSNPWLTSNIFYDFIVWLKLQRYYITRDL